MQLHLCPRGGRYSHTRNWHVTQICRTKALRRCYWFEPMVRPQRSHINFPLQIFSSFDHFYIFWDDKHGHATGKRRMVWGWCGFCCYWISPSCMPSALPAHICSVIALPICLPWVKGHQHHRVLPSSTCNATSSTNDGNQQESSKQFTDQLMIIKNIIWCKWDLWWEQNWHVNIHGVWYWATGKYPAKWLIFIHAKWLIRFVSITGEWLLEHHLWQLGGFFP